MTPASSIPSGGLLSWGLFCPQPLHLFLLSRGGGRKEILGLPLEARGAPTLRLPMTSQDPEDFSDTLFFPKSLLLCWVFLFVPPDLLSLPFHSALGPMMLTSMDCIRGLPCPLTSRLF